MIAHAPFQSAGLWADLGAGCCADTNTDALFNGDLSDLNACQDKCTSFGDRCGYINFGWASSAYCTVIEKGTSPSNCAERDTSANGCGSSGNNGVHAYKYTLPGQSLLVRARTYAFVRACVRARVYI